MRYFWFAPLFWLLIPAFPLAQPDTAAALRRLAAMDADTDRVLYLLEVGDLFERSDRERAAVYYHRARELAGRIGYPYGEGKAWLYLGYLSNVYGDYPTAIQHNRAAYEIFAAIPDSLEMAKALTNVANAYNYQSAPRLALPAYLAAAELFERRGRDDYLLLTLGNINAIFSRLGNVAQQLAYAERMLRIAPGVGDSVLLTDAHQKYGLALLDAGRYAEARPALEHALRLARATAEPVNLAVAYSNLGEYHFRREDFGRAEELFARSLGVARAHGDPFYVAEALHDVGKARMQNRQYARARGDLTTALRLARANGNLQVVQEVYASLGELEARAEVPARAAEYWRRHAALQDSLFDRDAGRQVAALDAHYQTELRENRIAALEVDNQLQQLRLRQRTTQLLLLGGGVVVLLGLLYLLRRSARQRREIDRQAAALREREIAALRQEQTVVALRATAAGEERERLRIAEDLHDDFGAGLARIAFLSAAVAARPTDGGPTLEKIAGAARQLQLRLGEIVWALNTRNDRLPGLVAYLRRYVGEFFAGTDIEPRVIAPSVVADRPLPGERRREIFLIVKEALHNVLKHSGATWVYLRVTLSPTALEISVEDNGRGFDPAADPGPGNGLRNLRKRAARLGGQVQVTVADRTAVRLTVPLAPAPDPASTPKG